MCSPAFIGDRIREAPSEHMKIDEILRKWRLDNDKVRVHVYRR